MMGTKNVLGNYKGKMDLFVKKYYHIEIDTDGKQGQSARYQEASPVCAFVTISVIIIAHFIRLIYIKSPSFIQ